MNPFKEKPLKKPVFETWDKLYPKSYDKREVDPYTKTRIILMNGTEFESNWFSHQFDRHVRNNDLRRELALTRAQEKRQQIKISMLKPVDESVLEHTIGYEQLAVDLTAELAKKEKDFNVKKALDFALLEDFDHLYRYANKLEMEQGVVAERLVGKYTEIMPGRPTIAHHRYPTDNVRKPVNNKKAETRTVLATMIITAAEQQTMNYYMNVANFGNDDLSRRLYQEIALVEEEHVTQYESLIDPKGSCLEMLLWHEYCECYLYWSCYMTETDEYIKGIWEENFRTEISHLHGACELMKTYGRKDPEEVIPDGKFPEPLSLHENVDYVRDILANTAQYTSVGEDYEKVENLPKSAAFFKYGKTITPDADMLASHNVIQKRIFEHGKDYRFEVKPEPVEALRSRKEDNVSVGIVPGEAESRGFRKNPVQNTKSKK